MTAVIKRHVLMSLRFEPICEVEPSAVVGRSYIALADGTEFLRRGDLETDTSVVWVQLPDEPHFVPDSKVTRWYGAPVSAG